MATYPASDYIFMISNAGQTMELSNASVRNQGFPTQGYMNSVPSASTGQSESFHSSFGSPSPMAYVHPGLDSSNVFHMAVEHGKNLHSSHNSQMSYSSMDYPIDANIFDNSTPLSQQPSFSSSSSTTSITRPIPFWQNAPPPSTFTANLNRCPQAQIPLVGPSPFVHNPSLSHSITSTEGSPSMSYSPYHTGYRRFSAQSMHQPAPMSSSLFAASIAQPSPRHPSSSASFVVPASQVVNYPPTSPPSAQPISTIFEGCRKAQDAFDTRSTWVSSPYENSSIASSDSDASFAGFPMKPFPVSSPSSFTSSSNVQTPASWAVDHPRGSLSPPQSCTSSNQLSLSPTHSTYDNHHYRPSLVENLRKGQAIMRYDYTARQALHAPLAPPQRALEVHGTDVSTLLRGETELYQYQLSGRSLVTGSGTSSKRNFVEPHQVHAQRAGQSSEAGYPLLSYQPQESMPVVRQNKKPDYGMRYANRHKSMPYPEGLPWLSTPQVVPRNGFPRDFPDSATSSLSPQEPKCNDGTSRQRSGEKAYPSKRKHEGHEETYGPLAASSLTKVPAPKRSKGLPKNQVRYQAILGRQKGISLDKSLARMSLSSSKTSPAVVTLPSKPAKGISPAAPLPIGPDTEEKTASEHLEQVRFEFEEDPHTALALASASTSPSFPFPPASTSTQEVVMHEDMIDKVFRAATFGPPKVKDPFVENTGRR